MFDDTLFSREGTKLNVNDDLLNLFSYFDGDTSNFKFRGVIPPYESLKRWYFDLETEGLNPNIHAIKMIGNKLSSGSYLFMDWTEMSEYEMILNFYDLLDNLKPDVLTGYNIWKFDIPFLIRRSEILGIKHPFKGGRQKFFRTAQKFGQPFEFTQYWLNGVNIIDCYPQVLAKDFVERKLTGHSLKVVPAQWGLRDCFRTELSYNEMLTCYKTDNAALMKEYLKDDLDDTELICNIVLPDIYYQKLFLDDWSLQSLATSGNGSKWNSILSKFYGYEPKADPKLSFKGGFTQGKAGLYRDVEKLDVSSLYPSIMLTYGICSRKDPLAYQLKLLRYLRDERLRLKAIAFEDKEADRMQGAMKIFINSAYGFLGVTGCPFNDMLAGSLVTAYGRRIVKLMKSLIIEAGCEPIEIDTDGIIYALNGNDGSLVHQFLNKNMPRGIEIDREKLGGKVHSADILFIPPATDNKGNVKYIDEDFDPEKGKENTIIDDSDTPDVNPDILGLRKNYILITNSNGNYKTIAKGKYRKRNISELEKTFQVEFLKKFLVDESQAIEYYQGLINTIKSGSLDSSLITIVRKASKAEKDVFKRGLVDDEGMTTYYIGQEVIQMKRKTKIDNCKVNKGLYSIPYYLNVIEKQFKEMEMFI